MVFGTYGVKKLYLSVNISLFISKGRPLSRTRVRHFSYILFSPSFSLKYLLSFIFSQFVNFVAEQVTLEV